MKVTLSSKVLTLSSKVTLIQRLLFYRPGVCPFILLNIRECSFTLGGERRSEHPLGVKLSTRGEVIPQV
jgi:hypothetical protein